MLTDNQVRRNIARNVKRLRGQMSRYRLAKAVGVGTIHISRIEKAKIAPSPGLLSRLAEVLGVSTDSLISGRNGNGKKI